MSNFIPIKIPKLSKITKREMDEIKRTDDRTRGSNSTQNDHETHTACIDRVNIRGASATCCFCDPHEGCTLGMNLYPGKFIPVERLPEASKTIDRALQEDMTKAIKHAGKYMKKEQDKIMPPDEFCPECLSLKRKPNKECVNHESYWISTKMQELHDEPWRLFPATIDEFSKSMVKTIANKHIVVQDTHEGKIHQRHWYLQAQKMLKKLVKEYEKLCKTSYD